MKTRRRNGLTTTRSKKRSKTLENGRENSLSIPIDLMIDIFSWLPVKAIGRCRCVSKVWASILRRPDFTELFLTRSCARPQLLFACQKGGELFFFSAPHPQNLDENSFTVTVTANHHMKFSFDSSFGICGLGHGLVGVYIRTPRQKEKMVVICNPSTGQSLPLPEVKKTERVKARSFLGYDPIDKKFKVLSISGSLIYEGKGNDVVPEELQVMTLGTGELSWRLVEIGRLPLYTPSSIRRYNTHDEICINGVIYYPFVRKYRDTYIIVCFDVRSEKLSCIKVKEALYEAVLCGTPINYSGKLGLLLAEAPYILHRRSRSFKLWVLEDLEKQSWSEHLYLLPALWGDTVGNALLRFVGATRTNEIVFASRCPYGRFYLFYLNIERNTVVRVEIQGMDVSKYDRVLCTFLDHVEDVKLM